MNICDICYKPKPCNMFKEGMKTCAFALKRCDACTVSLSIPDKQALELLEDDNIVTMKCSRCGCVVLLSAPVLLNKEIDKAHQDLPALLKEAREKKMMIRDRHHWILFTADELERRIAHGMVFMNLSNFSLEDPMEEMETREKMATSAVASRDQYKEYLKKLGYYRES